MLANSDDDLLRRQADTLRRAVENALVGLMRHEPVDIGGSEPGRRQRFLDGVGDIDDGMAKDLPALHTHMAGGLRRGRATIDIELLLEASIRMEMRRQNASVGIGPLALARLDDNGPRPVAEKDACGAV